MNIWLKEQDTVKRIMSKDYRTEGFFLKHEPDHVTFLLVKLQWLFIASEARHNVLTSPLQTFTSDY